MSANGNGKPLSRTFTKIPGAKESLISRPAEGAVSAPSDPQLILIFGWMNGQLTHIYKYTEVYNKLYPGATQIVVRSESSLFWTSYSTLAKHLIPVAKIVQDYYNSGRVLVHTFSNGGLFMLCAMSMALTHVRSVPSPVPASIVIYDSCPGHVKLSGAVEAFTTHIKNPIFRWICKALVFAWIGSWMFLGLLLRKPSPFVIIRRWLLTDRVVPMQTPRTYIYSKADKLVHWMDVESHAEKAKAAGQSVDLELFDGTAHVHHMRGNSERYWAAVQRAWNRYISSTTPSVTGSFVEVSAP